VTAIADTNLAYASKPHLLGGDGGFDRSQRLSAIERRGRRSRRRSSRQL